MRRVVHGNLPSLGQRDGLLPVFLPASSPHPPTPPPHTRGSVSSHSSLSLGKSQYEEVPGKLAALSAAPLLACPPSCCAFSATSSQVKVKSCRELLSQRKWFVHHGSLSQVSGCQEEAQSSQGSSLCPPLLVPPTPAQRAPKPWGLVGLEQYLR